MPVNRKKVWESSLTPSGNQSKIFWDYEWEEYCVRFYTPASTRPKAEADYFTDSLEDGKGTAELELKRLDDLYQ